MAKLITTKSWHTTYNEDGTSTRVYESEESLKNRNEKIEDNAVQEAIDYFHKHRSIELLAIELKEKNTGIFRNNKAIELMEAAMLGKLNTGKGRTKPLLKQKRDDYMCRAIYHLKEHGLPIKADEDRDKQSACKLVGDKFCLSADAVYSVWHKWGKKNDCVFKNYEPLITPLFISDGACSPEQIADHFRNLFITIQSDYETEDHQLLEDFYDEYTLLNGDTNKGET